MSSSTNIQNGPEKAVVPKATKGKPSGKKAKPDSFREPGDWAGERELTFLYKDDQIHDLVQLAREYICGELSYKQLKSRVPTVTNFLRASERAKERVRGKKVLFIGGWCTDKNQMCDMERENPLGTGSCLTERILRGVERAINMPTLLIDFYHVFILNFLSNQYSNYAN